MAKLWKQLQHQLYILSEINTVNGQLMLFTKTKQYKCDRTVEQADAKSCENNDKNVYSDSIPRNMDIAINDSIQIAPYQAHTKVFATNIHIRRSV